MASDPKVTPAMKQYRAFKERHPGCVLLFRMGDFYEMFDEDAVNVSKAIGLTLTQRSEGQPMAGMPHQHLEPYLKKMLGAGFRVAVCDQLQDADKAKGVVPRGITRVVSPGTLVDDALLDADAINALGAVVFTGVGDASPASIAVVEVSTGAFTLVSVGPEAIIDELLRRGVRELIYADVNDGVAPPRVQRVLTALGLSGTPRPTWQFRHDEALATLTSHFEVAGLAGFGLADEDAAVPAAGALVRYLRDTQTISEADLKAIPAGSEGVIVAKTTLKHLRPPRREEPSEYLVIDAVSLRALEIERTLRGAAGVAGGASGDGSLLSIFVGSGAGSKSVCRTAMGKRLLRDWLCRPLRNVDKVTQRQNGVATLIADRTLAMNLGDLFEGVQDIPRIAGRVALGRCTPRDLRGLALSLDRLKAIRDVLTGAPSLADHRDRLAATATDLEPLAATLLKSLKPDPPANIRDGGAIADGIDPELDEARMLQHDAGAWLVKYQSELVGKFSLPGLKVGFNRVFGYYIELPQAQARSAPPELSRKQTLKNAERYTTPELRDFEGKVMSAEGRGLEREREIFGRLCDAAATKLSAMHAFSDGVAELDVLLGFAEKAQRRGWIRPTIVEEPTVVIHGGRHPVLDESLQGAGGGFVPNDVELGTSGGGDENNNQLGDESAGGAPTTNEDRAEGRSPARAPKARSRSTSEASLALITGPNMAGKSTFIRQTALLCLLAHTGSYIPADRATIGLIDRVFTRIGADDALHAGQSTFMVEMIETANILNHATQRSLVVLDEIGRGTSTLDGLSLAWAIVEHLAREHGPRTLFATHYHELTDLEDRFDGRIRNLHVAVREWPAGDDHAQIVFLHRILPGRADQSYGLHVARLAGIPKACIDRGREVLANLAVHHGGNGVGESGRHADTSNIPTPRRHDDAGQLALFTEYLPHPAIDALKEIKIDHLSPMQAFDTLRKLKGLTERE